MNTVLMQTKDNLLKRGYSVYLCESKNTLLNTIYQNILPPDISEMVIGLGNSITLEAVNLLEDLRKRSKTVYHHKPPYISFEDDRKALCSDVYFLSANAMSKDGYIVNIDGTGNRVAASCFGPKHVVFVIGKNKIVENLDEAMDRALNYTSIKLMKFYAEKLGRKTPPCVQVGKCVECFSPSGCGCGVMTIHRKQLFGNKTSVILVDEDMGI